MKFDENIKDMYALKNREFFYSSKWRPSGPAFFNHFLLPSPHKHLHMMMSYIRQ